MMQSMTVILPVVFALGGQVESVRPRLYPLTRQRAVDESTLDPRILSDRTVASRTHPDRQAL